MKNQGTSTVLQTQVTSLKWSVCEKFRDYLISSKFTVLTDNNPLTYDHIHIWAHLKSGAF